MHIVAALVWPALALVFAAIFSGLWYADRQRQHLLGFAAGFFALFITMTVNIAVPSIDPIKFVPPLHGLACLSVIAIIWGATKRLGQRAPMFAMLGLTLFSSMLLSIALETSELPVALLVQNDTSGLLFAIGAVVLWTARSTHFLDRFLVWTMSLLAGFSLLRPLLVLFLHLEIATLFEHRIEIHAATVVISTLLTVVLGVVLVSIAIRDTLEIRHRDERSDPISGFLDQHTFEQFCEPAVTTAQRLSMPVTLAILELDRFDALQERWGKETVDRIIREISDVLRSWKRDSDIIGRVGEYRFGVLFVGVGANSAQDIIQNLRKEVDKTCNEALSEHLKFTLSASIAQCVAGINLKKLMCSALQPLSPTGQFGSNVTFVNGSQTQLTPLSTPEHETFITLG